MSNIAPSTATKPPRKFYFDPKWIIILGIVLFMLVFQVFPILYLVVKAFFPDGSFSLETFELLRAGHYGMAALYAVLSAALCVLAVLLVKP